MPYTHKATRVWNALKRATNLEEAEGILDYFNLPNEENSRVLRSWLINRNVMKAHGII